MTEIVVRQAEEENGPRIGEIFTASRSLMPYLPRLHTPEEEADFICDSVLKEKTVFAAIIDRQIIGFLARSGNWLDHLYVHPNHLCQGVGTRLLQTVQDQAEELTLWTFQQNTMARMFYEKHGFRPVEWTDGRRNMEKLPDVRYLWAKRLPAEIGPKT